MVRAGGGEGGKEGGSRGYPRGFGVGSEPQGSDRRGACGLDVAHQGRQARPGHSQWGEVSPLLSS